MRRGIVAIRLRALGDVVLTTAALRSLAHGAPGEPLHVVTEPRFADVLEGHPEITRVWPLERSAGATLSTMLALRRLRPRVAVDFFGNSRSALLARGSGAPEVFGYDLRGRRHLYTHTVPREERGPGDRREAAASVHLRLARAAGGAPGGPEPHLRVSDRRRKEAQALLEQAGVEDPERTVGLVVAGSWPTKMWPLSHSAVLARRLQSAGHGVLALVGPGEESLARRLTALAPSVRLLPPCGTASLAAVIAQLRAVVGTDSGPRHLAAALGVPSFAWFGPTHPDTWNPPGAAHGYWRTELPCRGCDRTACAHWNCLPGLAPDEGARLVLDHLERHGRQAADLHPAAGA